MKVLLTIILSLILYGCTVEKYVYNTANIPDELIVSKAKKPIPPKPKDGKLLQSEVALYIIELNAWGEEINSHLKAIYMWNESMKEKK